MKGRTDEKRKGKERKRGKRKYVYVHIIDLHPCHLLKDDDERKDQKCLTDYVCVVLKSLEGLSCTYLKVVAMGGTL